MTTAVVAPAISSDQALRIAQADGVVAYGDLTRFRVEITLEDDGWHVKHFIQQRNGSRIAGGGPHYIIDATTGTIVSAKYFQ
jgi:hypothetical protein